MSLLKSSLAAVTGMLIGGWYATPKRIEYRETEGKCSVNLISPFGVSTFPIGEWRMASSGPDETGVTVVYRWHAAPGSVYTWGDGSRRSATTRLSGHELVPTKISWTRHFPGYSGNVGLDGGIDGAARGLPTQTEVATAFSANA